MRPGFDEHLDALERERAWLEKMLEADANWRALARLEARKGKGIAPSLTAATRSSLEAALAANPLYAARARIMEAISALSAPESTAAPSQEGTASGMSVQSGTKIADATPLTRPFRKDATTNRASVTIHGAQPDPVPDAGQTPPGPADDLTRIRGVDAPLAARLVAHGVTNFPRIAAWSPADVVRIAKALGLGRRVSAENWIEQAALLAGLAGSGEGSSVRAEPAVRNAPRGDTASARPPPRPPATGNAATARGSSPRLPDPGDVPLRFGGIPRSARPRPGPFPPHASMVSEAAQPVMDPEPDAGAALGPERPGLPLRDLMVEEAEVTIVERDATLETFEEGPGSGTPGPPAATGSLRDRLRRTREPEALDAGAYAAYRDPIDEASVEIVPAGDDRDTSSPGSADAGNIDRPDVNRFRKALEGS